MCRLVDDTRERTSIDAFSILRCRLSTIDPLEKFRNAGWITNNLGCPTIEDRCRASYYSLSLHRNAIERRLPVALLIKSVSALATEQIIALGKLQTSAVKETQVKSPV